MKFLTLFSCLTILSGNFLFGQGSSPVPGVRTSDLAVVDVMIPSSIKTDWTNQSAAVKANTTIIASGMAHTTGRGLKDLTDVEFHTAFQAAKDIQLGQQQRRVVGQQSTNAFGKFNQ